MTDDEDLAPFEYLVMEFPGDMMHGSGLALLADILDVGVGRVIDLVFIRKEPDSSITLVDVDVAALRGALDLSSLELACPGHLGEAEIAQAGDHIDIGSSAGILVFEKARVGPAVVVPLQRTPTATPSTPSTPPLLAGSAG